MSDQGNLSAAVSYAERGWYVAPVNIEYLPGQKKKVRFLVDWGTKASHDPEIVRDWYVEHPYAGVAIAMKKSGLVGVDLDGPEGLTNWLELVEKHCPDPDTLATTTHRTPSGGLHLIFTDPAGQARNSASELAPGIDVRGAGPSNGGVLFAPPTKTARGEYEVVLDVEPIPAPEWLWELIRKPEPVAIIAETTGDPLFASFSGEPASEDEALERVRKLAERLAGWGKGANTEATRLAFMAGQYAGAGQVTVEKVTSIMLGALDGWTYEPGGQESMEATIRLQVIQGSHSPRAWVSERKQALQNEAVVTRAIDFGNAGMAEHLADAFFRGKFIRTTGLGWLRWTGTYWRTCDESAPQEAIRKYCRKQLMDAVRGGDLGSNAARGWAKYNGTGGVTAVLRFLGGMDGIYREAEELDSWPDLLNTPEGVLSLTSFALRAHDPELLLTKITAANYRPGIVNVDLEKALSCVPEDARAWLQVHFGAGVSGRPKPRVPAVLLTGKGRNGKSLLCQSALQALGKLTGAGYAAQVPNELLLLSKTGTGAAQPEKLMLRGVRFAYIEETPEGRYLDVNALKKVVGTRVLTARDLYKAPVTFLLTHVLFINTNFPPRVTETDTATWDRLTALRFPKRYRKKNDALGEWLDGDEEGDAGLEERMASQDALDAMLTWMIDGYRMGRTDEVTTPEAVADSVTEWRKEGDYLLRFLEDVFVFDKDSWVPSEALYASLRKWSDAHGQQKPPPSNTIASRLAEHTGLPYRLLTSRVLSSREGVSLPPATSWLIDGEPYRPSGRQTMAYVGLRFKNADD